jgi:fatty acid synthase subunit alpha
MRSSEHTEVRAEVESLKSEGRQHDDYFASRVSGIEKEVKRQETDGLAMYGMLEVTDPRVAPLQRVLAIWGLTGDDIGVLSNHGTTLLHRTFSALQNLMLDDR